MNLKMGLFYMEFQHTDIATCYGFVTATTKVLPHPPCFYKFSILFLFKRRATPIFKGRL